MNTVYTFLADGFEEVEALAVVDCLVRAGLNTKTVSVNGSNTVTGAHNIKVVADIEFSEGDFSDADVLFFPGGMPGTLNLEKCPTVINAVKYCAENGLLISAICAAPSILGHLGLLKGKKAVCFPSFESELEGYKACDEFVCRDGNIITAKGMGVSVDFGLEILSYLKGKDVSGKIRGSIQCR